MGTALRILSAWAPYIWIAECIFGLLVCSRLLVWTKTARRVPDIPESVRETVRYLGHLAWTAFTVFVLFAGIGVSGLFPDELSASAAQIVQLLTLVMLVGFPGILAWITYKAFELRGG